MLLCLVYFGGERKHTMVQVLCSVTDYTNHRTDRRGRDLTRIEDNKQDNERGRTVR